jgi:hypothetical protein
VIRGLLKIAKLAMPDTYFASDRRVRAAKRLLLAYERVSPKRTR